MERKEKIARNFSKAAKTYDVSTPTQKVFAEELATLFGASYDTILEIGAGTGHLTKHIVQSFPMSGKTINDLSFDMLKSVQTKLEEKNLWQEPIALVSGDGEKIELHEKFDLITSSSVFQWFDNLQNAFVHYRTMLSQKGEFIFSMYGCDTLIELNNLFKELLPGHVANLDIPCFDDVREMLINSGYRLERAYEKRITRQFLSLTEILQHQKLSGAVNIDSNSVVTKREWMNIINEYNRRYVKNDGVYATYHVYCFKARV